MPLYNTALKFKLALLVVVLLLGAVTWDGILLLLSRWTYDEAYNHGFILSALIAYLLFQERGDLRKLEFSQSWLGFCLFAAMVFIALIAYVTQILTLQYQAFLGAMCFLIIAVMGKASLKVLLPLSLLVFAIPLPYFSQVVLTADLQLASTHLSVVLLRMFEVPVFVEGNIIDFGGYSLQVVEACAGLNYMVPLLGLGHIMAFMFKTVMWKRVLLVVSCVPISIFLNSLRIAMTGMLMDSYGSEVAEGFFHAFQGWLIFLVSMVLLIIVLVLLNKIGAGRINLGTMLHFDRYKSEDASASAAVKRNVPNTLFAALLVSFCAAGIAVYLEAKPEFIPERPKFEQFPERINAWRGEQFPGSLEQIEALGADDHLFANYQYDQAEELVGLYVAYFDRQSDDKNPHSPKACLPGSGWDILSIEQVTRKVSETRTIPLNKMIIQKGRNKQILYYWFNLHGRELADEYHMKAYMLRDRLLLNRSDGAIVRLTSGVYPGETEEVAEERMNSFLMALNPELMKFIPQI